MSIKPILFSTPMVQAILAGRKTMTRRVIVSHTGNCPKLYPVNEIFSDPIGAMYVGGVIRPRYQPGDILWVRETWREYCVRRQSDSKNHYCYKADHERGYVCFNGFCDLRWRPSIFMPKEAARLFLRVTDVRVERVQDISPEDCESEGYFEAEPVEPRPRSWFSAVWDACNAKRGYGWDTNPWVWAYTFEPTDKPEGWPAGEPAP